MIQFLNNTFEYEVWINDSIDESFTDIETTAIISSDAGLNDNIDMKELEEFQFYAWGVVANIVVCLGVIGNILSITVLNHRRMQSSTSCYLTALAVFDTLLLISMSLFLAIPAIKTLESYTVMYPYMHPFAYPLALTAQLCTIYTTVAFTIERYIAVCHPLYSTQVCTIPRARKGIMAIVICSILYNIPRILEHEIKEQYDSNVNATRPEIVLTEFGKNNTFREVYFIYLQLIIFFVAPFCIILILNILLIRAVRRSYRSHQKNSKPAKERTLTMMVIALVIVFLICQFPSIIDNILEVTLSPAEKQSGWVFKLYFISNLMVVINSATNFVIYCLFGNKFRSVFVRMFCPCIHKKLARQRTLATSVQSTIKARNRRYMNANTNGSSPEHMTGTISPKQGSSMESLKQSRDTNANCNMLTLVQWNANKKSPTTVITWQERRSLLGNRNKFS